MNLARFIQGIIVGGLFSGFLTALCAVYIAYTSNTTSSFIEVRDIWWFWLLLMFYAGFLGLIPGGILGGAISLLNLSLTTAGMCGFLITGIPVIFLMILNYDSPNDAANDFRRFGAFFL